MLRANGTGRIYIVFRFFVFGLKIWSCQDHCDVLGVGRNVNGSPPKRPAVNSFTRFGLCLSTQCLFVQCSKYTRLRPWKKSEFNPWRRVAATERLVCLPKAGCPAKVSSRMGRSDALSLPKTPKVSTENAIKTVTFVQNYKKISPFVSMRAKLLISAAPGLGSHHQIPSRNPTPLATSRLKKTGLNVNDVKGLNHWERRRPSTSSL